MEVFRHDADRRFYLSLLQEGRDRTSCEFLAWCLMPNHVHFIIIPPEPDSLAELFRWTHGHYTRYLNKQDDCTGHLWQERFHSSPLSDAHRTNALRYILMNPVEAGMCEKSVDYDWSSARFTFQSKIGDPLIKRPLPQLWVENLKAMGSSGIQEDRKKIDYYLRNNFAYGTEKPTRGRSNPERFRGYSVP